MIAFVLNLAHILSLVQQALIYWLQMTMSTTWMSTVMMIYHDSKSRLNITSVDAFIAYEKPQTGDLTGLLINQAIVIPFMQNLLLYPMQYHLNNILVNYMQHA